MCFSGFKVKICHTAACCKVLSIVGKQNCPTSTNSGVRATAGPGHRHTGAQHWERVHGPESEAMASAGDTGHNMNQSPGIRYLLGKKVGGP